MTSSAQAHPPARRRSLGWLGACTLALLASGCATAPSPGTDTTRLSGRLGITVQNAPDRSLSAHFELIGDARQGRLVLSNALGLQLGEALWGPNGAELVTSEGRRTYASAPDMAEQLLGERLPLQALPDWLRGRPWTGAPYTEQTASFLGFTQEGWLIDRTELDQGRLLAQRPQPAPAITVRVRLDRP